MGSESRGVEWNGEGGTSGSLYILLPCPILTQRGDVRRLKLWPLGRPPASKPARIPRLDRCINTSVTQHSFLSRIRHIGDSLAGVVLYFTYGRFMFVEAASVQLRNSCRVRKNRHVLLMQLILIYLLNKMCL